ncbi:hypothetical protein FQR65_LT09999 [Abscondita terminalis]|nr:hypothetical protein FQR65_LT09999 [Abscondita terminalis]
MSTINSIITTNFLRNLIEKYNRDVENLDFVIVPISAGDNFASTVYIIKINYNTFGNDVKEESFILKYLTDDELLSHYAKLMKLYDNEIDMYNRILPTISSLEYVNKFWATTLYATLIPQPILILDDLTKQGYRMQSRHQGLDLNHCILIIEKLAYLHASSIAIKDKETLENFNLGIFWVNQYTIEWITVGLQCLIETCSNFNHLIEFATKLKSIQNNVLEKTFASIKNSKIGKVLNHGDCWVNNLMFSYNSDGSVKDAVLLDLQVCLYSSPVIDLHCFWATSPNIEVLAKHFDEVLDYYYKRFIDNVKKLKITGYVPSKLELMTDFKEKVIYGLNTLLTMTPFIKVDKRPDATIENFYKYFDKDSFRYDCYNNERYLERITLLLAFYDSFGVFQ